MPVEGDAVELGLVDWARAAPPNAMAATAARIAVFMLSSFGTDEDSSGERLGRFPSDVPYLFRFG
jgi:hypothetical protein